MTEGLRCRSCGCGAGQSPGDWARCPGPLGTGGVCRCHIPRELWPEAAEPDATAAQVDMWRAMALAGGPYSFGRWANELVHADPCDCDLDEENAGERCMDGSDWRWAVLVDGGAFAPRPVVLLPRRPPPQPEDDDWVPPELGVDGALA